MNDRFNKFTVLTITINRCIHKIKDNEMKKMGLKGTHVSCLYYLYRANSEMTATELCSICGEDKAIVSRSIEYLEHNGYIDCDTKTGKRYKSPLYLSQKGKEVGEYINNKVEDILRLASKDISDQNRKILYDSLEIIKHNLENYVLDSKTEA